MQQLVEAPGVATADKDGLRLLDCVHRVVELMDADSFHPQALAKFIGPGIPIAADHRVGYEQDTLDLFAGEQGLHPLPGPAEQTLAFGGFTVAKKKQFHQQCPHE